MILAWLPLALIAYFMLAANGTIDRIIVHKEVTKPIVVSFWVAAFSVPTIGLLLIGLLPFEFTEEFRYVAPDAITLIKILSGGFLTQAALLFMYRALHDSEATRVLSIMGGVTPIATLIASYIWLDERIGSLTAIAISVLIAGTVALTMGRSSKQNNGMMWLVNAIWAAILLAAQSVIIKQVYDDFHFWTAYALMALGALIYLMLIVVSSKSVRDTIFTTSAPKKKVSKKAKQKKSQVLWIFGNSMLGGLAVIVLNMAIDQGSPTLVNSMRGVQYATLFLVALVLAKRHPHLLDEELTKRSIIQKISGIILITLGVALLAISA